jgi:hypothetical protein
VSTVELSDCSALFEVQPPVLGRPTIFGWVQYPHDFSLVPRQSVQNGSGWRRGRFQQQIVTFDFEVNTGSASRPSEPGLRS